MNEPVQVDPFGCGCTECLTGLYVPLDRATDEHIVLLINGTLSDATSERITITTTTTSYLSGLGEPTVTVTVTAEYCGRTWDLSRFAGPHLTIERLARL